MLSNDEIFADHPAKTLVWLQQWLEEGKRISLPSEVNWLGLAETAAAKACSQYRKYSVTDSLLWGQIAITIREELAKNNAANQEASHTYLLAMLVRTNLISQFGSFADDPVCDARLVIDWFYRTLTFSFEECEHLIGLWPSSADFDFKMVFERLSLLQCLHQAQRIVPDEKLLRWLRLLELFEKTKKDSRGCPMPDPSQIKITYTSDLF